MSAFIAARRRQLITAIVIFAVIALVPRFVSDVYMMNVLILTLLFAALSQSWNLLGAIAGRSRSDMRCISIGAYATSFT
jgi:branched-chain amino acid transport system permease protein